MKLDLDLNKKYLLGLSMGSDSLSLFYLLKNQGYDFCVAHVNYHHRQEADEETEALINLCKQNNIKYFIKHAYYAKGNFEDFARNVRYEFFAEIINSEKIDYLVVAHNLNDLIETYYLQKKRGLVSYYGLKRETVIKGVKVLRPLLNVSKKKLEEFCIENNYKFYVDKSNFDTRYSRNKIRQQMKNYSEDDLKRIILDIDKENERLHFEDENLKSIVKNNSIALSDFQSLDEENQIRALFQIYQCIPGYILKSSKARDLIEKISKKEGPFAHDEGDYELIKDIDCLKLVKKRNYNYVLQVSSLSKVENEYICFDFVADPKFFYLKEDSFPLTITNALPSDKVRIGKINKKVKDILSEGHVPLLMRRYYPKVIDRYGKIIFLPRSIVDKEGRYIVKKIVDML